MQHLTLIFDQICLFFAQKMPKNSLSFFELIETWRKTHPLVCQKHPLSVRKMIYQCSKMPSQCIKKHLIFAPSVLTNMLSIVNLQYSIWSQYGFNMALIWVLYCFTGSEAAENAQKTQKWRRNVKYKYYILCHTKTLYEFMDVPSWHGYIMATLPAITPPCGGS